MESLQKKKKRHTILLLAALILLAVAGGAGTLALYHTATDKVTDTYIAGTVDARLSETLSDGVKKSVTVTNTGTEPVYVRVSVTANTVDAYKNVTGMADVKDCLNGQEWIFHDGYYYYGKALPAEASTTNLLSKQISLKGRQVTILVETIQSEPDEAVLDAWGYIPGR